jgi:phosphoesterase RecJ-like protein
MNYKESGVILTAIKKSEKILISCHRGPDADSVGSSLALSQVIQDYGKDVSVICPSDVPPDLMFLKGADKIKRVNFTSFDFSDFDLFIVPDSSTYAFATGQKGSDKPKIDLVVIDHHFSNEKFGKINLVDSKITSTGELLYKIFWDWKVAVSKDIAECLLTGIIGDTGTFQYPGVGRQTLQVAGELMEKGADKGKIVFNLFRNIDFKEIKLWGKLIEQMKIEDGFVWSAIPLSVYKDFGEYVYAKEDAANLFFPVVKDTEFGIVMVETSENLLSVSLRSRTGFDVSKIAGEVGGGGHKAAAGARIEGLPFSDAIEKVLSAAKKHVKKV